MKEKISTKISKKNIFPIQETHMKACLCRYKKDLHSLEDFQKQAGKVAESS